MSNEKDKNISSDGKVKIPMSRLKSELEKCENKEQEKEVFEKYSNDYIIELGE